MLGPSFYKYGPLLCWVGYALLWWLILPRLRWDASPSRPGTVVPQRAQLQPSLDEHAEHAALAAQADVQGEPEEPSSEEREPPTLADLVDEGPDVCNSSQHLRRHDRWLDIGVASLPEHFDQRNKVRRAWLQDLRARHQKDSCIRARFFIGHDDWVTASQGQKPTPEQLALELKISAETDRHGDILRIMMVDRQKNLPDKVFQILDKGVEDGYSFILKVSDNVDLNAEKMQEVFRKLNPNTHIYGGAGLVEKRLPDQDVSQNPPYFLSPSYFLTWPLAKNIVRSERTVELFGYATKAEDATVGHWVQQAAESVDEIVYKTASYTVAQ